MVNTFSSSASGRENSCRHRCAEAIERLLRTNSGGNSISSEPFQDLVIALEQALSLAQTSRCNAASTGRCHFCLLTLKVIRIAEHIQTKYDNIINDRAFLWSIHQFEPIRGEIMENLTSDCNLLKELLQSIIIIQERESATPISSNANLLERAQGARIKGGTITNDLTLSSLSGPTSWVLVV